MINKFCLLLFIFSTFVFIGCSSHTVTPVVDNLRCEYLTDPLGIDVISPRLSWEISSAQRGIMQTSYQVIVASSPDLLKKDNGDLWNSGRIISDASTGIVYEGAPLRSREEIYWKVKLTTNKGERVESATSYWSMGLLTPEEWSGRWTGLDSSFAWESPESRDTRLSARYFRKDFKADKTVRKAIAYVSGMGLYQFFMNGVKVGNGELSPAPTQYDKRVFYNTYDVTKQMEKGANAIGFVLGNGRFFTMRRGTIPAVIFPFANFGYPKMLVQLEIIYTDGTVQKVVSDTTWRVTAHGPIVTNNEFDGEDYNAQLEMKGWARAGFDDNTWLFAQSVNPPQGKVVAQMNPQIIVKDSLTPHSVTRLKDGKYLVDMGQNMVGWARIHIMAGKKDDTVTMRFAERINPDSTLYAANLRDARATDHYIMKVGEQRWEPHFTYHGFRYIEVEGYPGELSATDIQGRVVYDDLPETGHFETSNKVINQVYHNAFWGIRGNYRGMPTDCPQRDERMGWLGDRAVGSYGESFVFDHNTLYAKWLQDIEDAQRTSGSIPDVAPTYWEVYSDNMTWPAAYIIIANMLYHQFGNLEPIKKHYASMKLWLRYMKDKYMKDYILYKDTYGDWCMPPEDPHLIHSKLPGRITSGDYLGTAYYYRMIQFMEHFADLLSKSEDKQEFISLNKNILQAFTTKYLDRERGYYSNNTATANILALAYDMVPDSLRTRVFQNVINTTMDQFGGHVSTGLVGAQQLMRTLTNNGRPDIAYRLATNTSYPSWGYMAKEGATTIWELWNGNTADPAMNSGNHVMLLGDLLIWFYEDLAGIKSDDNEVGFNKIIMKPFPVDGLEYVNASYHSIHGMIKSNWKKKGNNFDWNISVPANTTATVYIPADDLGDITEQGKDITKAEGVRFVKMEDGRAVVEVGSGIYHFLSSYSK